ncbi:MAG: hypothetical protein WBA89_10300 [Microcoleus sp.]
MSFTLQPETNTHNASNNEKRSSILLWDAGTCFFMEKRHYSNGFRSENLFY